MKFMFVNYWEIHVIRGWKPALINAGHEVVEYGGYEHMSYYNGYGKAWNDILKEKPNYVIMLGTGHDIPTFDIIIEACKFYKIGLILHLIEDPPDFDKTLKFAKKAELVLSGDIDCVEKYKKMGINAHLFLPAINPIIHKSELFNPSLFHDMVLLANCYHNHPPRIKGYEIIVSAAVDLVEEYNYKFKAYGNWWDSSLGMNFLRNHKELDGKLFPIELVPSLCSSTKITLGVQCVDYSKTQTSPRPYEALACKSFHLTQWTPATENIFKEGFHLVTAKTKDEAKEKMIYYLNHPEEREKIAKQGQEYVYAEHTYDKRLKDIVFPNL